MAVFLLGPGRVLLGLGILGACGYLVATHDTDPTVRESGGLRAVYNGIAVLQLIDKCSMPSTWAWTMTVLQLKNKARS